MKYRVIENLEEQGDSVVYRAEDSQLHRSVAIRIVPESAAQKIERRQKLKQGALVAVTLLSVLSAIFLMQRGPASDAPGPVGRFSFSAPDLVGASISPDGRHVAYIVGGDEEASVWIRDLDRETPRQLAGTAGAQGAFWSPDSQFIGFATDRELKRIAVDGGDPITLCPLPGSSSVFPFLGGSWNSRGDRIVFSSGLELFGVPARGGTAELLVGREEVEGSDDRLHFVRPRFLPLSSGPQGLAYSFGTSSTDARLGVLDLETGERRELGTGAAPAYSASGHLVYQTSYRDSGLWALPLSLETLTPTGEAFRIVEEGKAPSVGRDGTLVYFDSPGSRGRILVWRDRAGKKLGTIGQEQERMMHPALSPNGKQVAVRGAETDDYDIWLHDAERGTKTRLTFDPGGEDHATWSASGEQISYYIGGGEPDDIYNQPADGSGEAVALPSGEGANRAPDWSADERYLIYWTRTGTSVGDLGYIERASDGSFSEPTAFLKTAADERVPKFSPDGRYVAYCSSESGRWEVYVRSFPDGGGRRQVSINGGGQPRWRRDGKELFYVEDTALMAVPVSTEGAFTAGSPEKLFESQDLAMTSPAPNYDVSGDGQRFVTVATVEGQTDQPPAIRVVQNWFTEFEDREHD